MTLRSTTIIAPLPTRRKLVPHAHPFAAAVGGIGIGVALLLLGLVYLCAAPFFWSVRRLASWHGHKGG